MQTHTLRIRADQWAWAEARAERLHTTPSHILRMAIANGQAGLDALAAPRASQPVADISDTAAALLAAGAEVRAQRSA